MDFSDIPSDMNFDTFAENIFLSLGSSTDMLLNAPPTITIDESLNPQFSVYQGQMDQSQLYFGDQFVPAYGYGFEEVPIDQQFYLSHEETGDEYLRVIEQCDKIIRGYEDCLNDQGDWFEHIREELRGFGVKKEDGDDSKRLVLMIEGLVDLIKKTEDGIMTMEKSIYASYPLLQRLRAIMIRVSSNKKEAELLRDEAISVINRQEYIPKIMLSFQEFPEPLIAFKSRDVGYSYVIKILQGFSLTPLEISGEVTCTVLESKKDYKMENNVSEIDNLYNAAVFENMKAQFSSRVKPVTLKFKANISINGQKRNMIIEAPNPIIVITNESQFAKAVKALLLQRIFKGEKRAPWSTFSFAIHHHFVTNINPNPQKFLSVRSIQLYEMNYFKKNSFDNFEEILHTKKVESFFEWIGEVERSLRFKRHIFKLWNLGYIYAFASRDDCAQIVTSSPKGSFLVRFSESNAGWFAITYKHHKTGNVVHYKVGKSEIGPSRSLPDYLKSKSTFIYILKIDPEKGIITTMEKDQALGKFYSKEKETNTEGYSEIPPY